MYTKEFRESLTISLVKDLGSENRIAALKLGGYMRQAKPLWLRVWEICHACAAHQPHDVSSSRFVRHFFVSMTR